MKKLILLLTLFVVTSGCIPTLNSTYVIYDISSAHKPKYEVVVSVIDTTKAKPSPLHVFYTTWSNIDKYNYKINDTISIQMIK